MDNIFEIKEEFKSTIVGFNGSGLPLGKRNDLHLLAEMALINPKGLGKYFVQMPTKEQILSFKENKFIEDHPAPGTATEELQPQTPEVPAEIVNPDEMQPEVTTDDPEVNDTETEVKKRKKRSNLIP